MTDTQSVLLMGTLDDEGLRRVLQLATTTGYQVDHARPERLRVSGNGAGMRVWKMGEELVPPLVVFHQNMKVMDPLFCLLETWERRGVLVLNTTLAGHANISKWSQQRAVRRVGYPSSAHRACAATRAPVSVRRSAWLSIYVEARSQFRRAGVVPVGHGRHIRELERDPGWYDRLRGTTIRIVRGRTQSRKGPKGRRRRWPHRHGHGTHGERIRHRRQPLRHRGQHRVATVRPEEGKYVSAAAEALRMAVCSVDYWLTDEHPEGISSTR